MIDMLHDQHLPTCSVSFLKASTAAFFMDGTARCPTKASASCTAWQSAVATSPTITATVMLCANGLHTAAMQEAVDRTAKPRSVAKRACHRAATRNALQLTTVRLRYSTCTEGSRTPACGQAGSCTRVTKSR